MLKIKANLSQYLKLLSNSWYTPIVLAALTTAVISKKISQYKSHILLSSPLGEVLVVNRALFKGEKIQGNDLSPMNLSLKHLPTGVLYPSDASNIIGTSINKSIAKDELLLWSSLDIDRLNQTYSDTVETGHRMISLPIDSVESMGYRVQRGDFIDLIHTAILDGQQSPTTYTLLQNIMVLNTGNKDDLDTSYSLLSLMVLPKEALMIKNAQQHGTLSLLLRNSLDQETSNKLPMISKQDIFEHGFRNSMQHERNKAIDIIKGNKYFPSQLKRKRFNKTVEQE